MPLSVLVVQFWFWLLPAPWLDLHVLGGSLVVAGVVVAVVVVATIDCDTGVMVVGTGEMQVGVGADFAGKFAMPHASCV